MKCFLIFVFCAGLLLSCSESGTVGDAPDSAVSGEMGGSGDANDEQAAVNFPHGYPEKYPQTLQQAFDILDLAISKSDRDSIRAMDKKDLISLHFGLGMWIRNNFGLWADNESLHNELGGGHPDDASMILIEKYWDHLVH